MHTRPVLNHLTEAHAAQAIAATGADAQNPCRHHGYNLRAQNVGYPSPLPQ